MANNTDIAIQKLSVETSRNAIMSAFGRFDPTLARLVQVQPLGGAGLDPVGGRRDNQDDHVRGRSWLTYNQLLMNGTSFSAGFNGSKRSSNNSVHHL